MTRRIFPGRMTQQEWRATPFSTRADLVRRAQCDLMGSFRFCTDKRCLRARTCRGEDPIECSRRIRHLRWPRPEPKTLRRKWGQLQKMLWQ